MRHHQIALSRVIESARDALISDHPRAHYADDVLSGHQRWSGADIKGKARRFGASYAEQRKRAARYLRAAGGMLCYVGPHHRLCACVIVGMDDYGNALIQSDIGAGIPAARGSAVVLIP